MVTILSASIFQHLAPLLQDEFFVASIFYPFLEQLVDEHKPDQIAKTLDLMTLYLEVLLQW